MIYDLAIIGGGPAGAAAAVYAARKQLKTVLIAEHFGGQSVESADIQNWIGTPHIPGPDLAKALEAHVREYATDWVDIQSGIRATLIEKTAEGFSISAGAEVFTTKTVLVATGGARRQLGIPGSKEYEHKGVVYCASCDGPLFAGQDVVVVGGGNAGFETAAQLLAYAKSVTLVHRSPEFKADPATIEKVLAYPNMRALKNTEPMEVKGGAFVEALVVREKTTGESREIPTAGVFVEIGMVPATDLVKNLAQLDEIGRIKVDCKNQRAYPIGGGTDGAVFPLWAAGDCTDALYHQNNIAAGDAVKALEDIYLFLKAH